MEAVGAYEFSRSSIIGHGAFAMVFKGQHRMNNTEVAVKCINKKNITQHPNILSKEIRILQELTALKHENVVSLFECKENKQYVFLVMEYCNGGDLAGFLQERGPQTEEIIAVFVKQIAAAVKVIHSKGIVHRDLKPQNILLSHIGRAPVNTADITLKIADFGFARFLTDGGMAATVCGSPLYMAPEVLMHHRYDGKADLWSVGTIAYQCLTGKAPFTARNPEQLRMIYQKTPNLQPDLPQKISENLRHLLIDLLKRNPAERMEFDTFFNHPFLSEARPVRSGEASGSSSKQVEAVNTTTTEQSAAIMMSPKTAALATSNKNVSRTPPQPIRSSRRCDSEGHNEGGTRGANKPSRPRTPSPSLEDDFVFVQENIPPEQSADYTLPRHGSVPYAISAPSPPARVISSPRVVELQNAERPKTLDFHHQTDQHDHHHRSPQHHSSDHHQSPSSGQHHQQSPLAGHHHQQSPLVDRQSPSQVSFQRQITKAATDNQFAVSYQKKSSSPMLVPGSLPSAALVPAHSGMSRPQTISRISSESSSGVESGHRARRRIASGSSVQMEDLSGVTKNTFFTHIPSIEDMSPPSVQFMIGTPPQLFGGGSSPLSSGPCSRCGSTTNLSSLPSRHSGAITYPSVPPHICGATPPHTQPPHSQVEANLISPDVNGNQEEGRRTSDAPLQIKSDRLRAAFEYKTPPSLSNALDTGIRSRSSICNCITPATERYGSTGSIHQMDIASSNTPPPSVQFAGTPSSVPSSVMADIEGPIMFSPPELQEATLMNKEHNELVEKFKFIIDLCSCLAELARTRNSPLAESMLLGSSCADSKQLLNWPVLCSEGERCMEQLLLQIRSLQLLGSALQAARTNAANGTLQLTSSIRELLRQMNDMYRKCLEVCKTLNKDERLMNEWMDKLSSDSLCIDRLLYGYAIQMCQTAATDEALGNPYECYQHYQAAYLLFHSLTQQADDPDDKALLNQFRDGVQKRLMHLHNRGYVMTRTTTTDN